jgi:hypothetical protein
MPDRLGPPRRARPSPELQVLGMFSAFTKFVAALRTGQTLLIVFDLVGVAGRGGTIPRNAAHNTCLCLCSIIWSTEPGGHLLGERLTMSMTSTARSLL